MDNGYKFVLFLHILAAIVAFGPLFVFPSWHKTGRTDDLAKLYLYVSIPALVLTWVLGMGLVGMSDKLIEMGDTWIVMALILWLAALAVAVFLIRPAITDRSEAARSKFAAGVGVTHLIGIVTLYLMVFKPGADGLL